MSNDVSPYSRGRGRQPRKAQVTILAEDVDTNLQEDLHQYWRIVRERLGFVLAVPAVFLGLAILRDMATTPLYTASSTVLIRSAPPPLLDHATVTIMSQSGASDLDSGDQTQNELLKSGALAERVIAAEGLAHDPTFVGMQTAGFMAVLRHGVMHWLVSRFRSSVILGNGTKAASLPTASQPNSLVGSYLSGLRVTPVPGTQITRISFTTADPKLSARLANAHAREFINWGIEMNAQESEEAEHFLEGKLAQIKKQLEASEAAVNIYRRDKGIVPGLISVNGREDVILERLNRIGEDLQKAHLETISLGIQVAMIREGKEESLPAVIGSSLVQKLKAELDGDETRYATLSARFKPDYPSMQQLARSIRGTREVLNREMSNAVASVEAQYQEAEQRESTLQDDLNQQKALAFGLNDSAVRYLILERDADTSRELYNAVLKRIKDLTVVADVHASNVLIVDRAESPGGPSSPQPSRDAFAAVVLGLVAGLGLAFVMDFLDNTLKDSREVESYLRIPSLGLIPQAPKSRESLYPSAESAETAAVNGDSNQRAITYRGRYSLLGEAYRNLRTGLMLSRAGSHPRTILITSAVPEEGKTTVSVNTAIVLAHAVGRVLLIDADLRIPRCHKVLGVSQVPGLTEVLTGLATLEQCIRSTSIDNLFLLASGQTPPNPSELLGSNEMKALLGNLCQNFDHIVIDSPPALPVSDPILISTVVDGVLLVAAGNRTPKQQVKAALARLRHAQAKIFGIVLNRIQIHKVDYFFPYYKHYGRVDEEEIEDTGEAPPTTPA